MTGLASRPERRPAGHPRFRLRLASWQAIGSYGRLRIMWEADCDGRRPSRGDAAAIQDHPFLPSGDGCLGKSITFLMWTPPDADLRVVVFLTLVNLAVVSIMNIGSAPTPTKSRILRFYNRANSSRNDRRYESEGTGSGGPGFRDGQRRGWAVAGLRLSPRRSVACGAVLGACGGCGVGRGCRRALVTWELQYMSAT